MSTPVDPIDPDLIRPTVEEVAALERTRTVGEMGAELGTFTTETRPTALEVEALVDQAMEAILGQLPVWFGITYYQRTRHAVALYAAILIEGSYFREKLDEGSVELYRELLRTHIGNLRAQIDADPVGEGGVVGSRGVDSVVVRSTMSDWDPILFPYL
jgi:hypothetical protein